MSFSKPTPSLDALRRAAKMLKRAHENGDVFALERLRVHPPRTDLSQLRHADYLHVIAQEQSFASWPALKLAADTMGLDRASRLQRLKVAMTYGQNSVAAHLLTETPDLAEGVLGLQIALYQKEAVAAALWADPEAAVRRLGPKSPIMHLCFSRWVHQHPELEADMLAIAKMLVDAGADVNDTMPVSAENDHPLSALYGAIGHSDNMALAAWLLAQGANPNDGESLYHATELGHLRGVELLLKHGADPRGTNALLRALDFDNTHMVRLLIVAGADVNGFHPEPIGGEAPIVIPALHQAARRQCGAEMVELLLNAGADPAEEHEGSSAYAYARVFGHKALAQAIEAKGVVPQLTTIEARLAAAADGRVEGAFLDPDHIPDVYRNIVRDILHLPGKLEHVKRLVALGVEYDRPDSEGLTPVQVAGWEGLPEVLDYFLSLMPDLTHVNGYGGTLLSTIIHGSENCPRRHERDYIACLKSVMTYGLALPQRAIDLAGNEEVAAFLSDWADRHPGQVVAGGLG